MLQEAAKVVDRDLESRWGRLKDPDVPTDRDQMEKHSILEASMREYWIAIETVMTGSGETWPVGNSHYCFFLSIGHLL